MEDVILDDVVVDDAVLLMDNMAVGKAAGGDKLVILSEEDAFVAKERRV